MSLTVPQTLDDLQSLMPFTVRTNEQEIDFVSAEHSLDFGRPFWHLTMEPLDQLDKAESLDKATVTFQQLREIVGARRPQPNGMIFHIGRCGSTLVSRMVGHDPGLLVVREAPVIGGLHRASSGSDRVPTFTVEQALKDMLVALDQFAAPRKQRIVAKHSSWESFSMSRIAEILPDMPLVFVYRNPVETVESSLDGYPGWGARIHEPRQFLQRWVPWIDRVPPPYTAASVYASVWAAGANAALSLPPDRVILVEHGDLTRDPERTLEQLRAHLSLKLDVDRALSELGHYSKARTDGTAFNPTGEHGHPSLSARTKAHVLDIVGDLPQQLAKRLAQQHKRRNEAALAS